MTLSRSWSTIDDTGHIDVRRGRFPQPLPEGYEERLLAVGVDVEQVTAAAGAIAGSLRRGRKVLLIGNGGSAADAQHMAAEFVGRFVLDRPPLAAIALTTDSSALTAIANDFGFEQVFARQVQALGRAGDIAIAISTSGESANVLSAVRTARRYGLGTIGITGFALTPLAKLVDFPIGVPGRTVAEVQEGHLLVEHALCASVEAILAAAARHPEDAGAAQGKLVEWDELLEMRRWWRDSGRTVVWTNGCFDLLHVGHVFSLSAARRLADVLVVGVNGDDSVRALKGPSRPLVPAVQRATLVAALETVDHVVVFEETTPEAALQRLQPDVHAKGADYADRPLPERAVVESYGGSVEFLPLVPDVSTTELVHRLAQEPRERGSRERD